MSSRGYYGNYSNRGRRVFYQEVARPEEQQQQPPQDSSSAPNYDSSSFRGRGRGGNNYRGGAPRGGMGAPYRGGRGGYYPRGRGMGGPNRGGRGGAPRQQPAFSLGTKIPATVLNKNIENQQLLFVQAPKPEIEEKEKKSLKLVSNLVPVSLIENSKYYSYDIKFEPEQENLKNCYKILQDHFPNKIFKFEGFSTVFSPEPLFAEKKHIFVGNYAPESKSGKEVSVTMALTKSEQPALMTPCLLQMMNGALENSLIESSHLKLGKLFLKLDEIQGQREFNGFIPLDEHFVDACPGIITSIIETEFGLSMSVDIGNRLLRRKNLLQIIVEKINDGEPQYTIAKELEMCSCYLRDYRRVLIHGIDFSKNPQSIFATSRFGKPMTFAQHFFEKYNISVSDMDQPLAYTIDRKTREKKFFATEMLTLSGKFERKVLSEIARKMGMDPDKRLKAIQLHSEKTLNDPVFQEKLENWGAQVPKNVIIEEIEKNGEKKNVQKTGFFTVDAHVLDAPIIIDGTNKTPQKDEKTNTWKISQPFREVKNTKLKWALIHPPTKTNYKIEDRFIDTFIELSSKMGFKISFAPKVYETQTDDPTQSGSENYKKTISEAVGKEKEVSFIIIVLEHEVGGFYQATKQLLLTEMGIICSCIKYKTITDFCSVDRLESPIQNMVHSLIAKLGGAPWSLSKLDLPDATMLVGMDVHHSSEKNAKKKKHPNQKERQESSWVGFVSTTDNRFSKFFNQTLEHPPGEEIMAPEDMKKLLLNSLKKFKLRNGIFPKYVILYRDGVSQGEEELVMSNETINGARNALLEVGLPIDSVPKLVVIVCVKRIHTKLFAYDAEMNVTSNPQSGTVVDSVITAPGKNQFFLISQTDCLGTVTPTKYVVLYNEPGFNMRYIEQLTHETTHLYFNYAGGIKVPHVCKMSHCLALMRGQVLVNDPHRSLTEKAHYL